MHAILSRAFFLGIVLLISPLSAQVVNFNFMEDYNSTNVNFGLGAAPDNIANTFWNRVGWSNGSFAAGRATMYNSDGTTLTTIRIAFDINSEEFGTGGAHGFANNLFRGYSYTDTGGMSFTISGLTIGQTYDFYFYSESGALDARRDVVFTLDGNVLSLTGVPQASFIEGANYVKFTLTPSATTLNGFYRTTMDEANFAGAQVAVSSVPEPSAYAALVGGLALCGVIAHRRRKSAPAT